MRKKSKNKCSAKFLKLFLTMCMVIGMVPVVVFALENNSEGVTVGDFTVTGDSSSYSYNEAKNTLTITGDVTVANTDPSTPTTDRIVVNSDVNANITLAGVNILHDDGDWKLAEDGTCAFEVLGTANITLTGENTLESGEYKAGLQVQDGATVTIKGTGSLKAIGGSGGSGIGCSSSGNGGNITITGGNVTANGGSLGAGIGGGLKSSNVNIIIEGGVVNATSFNRGAGIGGGFRSSDVNITISGGIVTAISKSDGSGIGDGREPGEKVATFSTGENGSAIIKASSISNNGNTSTWSGIIFDNSNGTVYGNQTLKDNLTIEVHEKLTVPDNITLSIEDGKTLVSYGEIIGIDNISGSVLNEVPTAPDTGDFIVTGNIKDYSYEGNTLIIRGDGEYTIKNKEPNTPSTDNIVVNSGVNANITLEGVNIYINEGNSTYGTCAFSVLGTANITLTGENALKSGRGKAGLRVRNDATVTITGTGSLKALGGAYGAGIGGDQDGSGGTIAIFGGEVNANGGSYAAGIGSGTNGGKGTITISGGEVNATGGLSGAGIGAGENSDAGTITISGGEVNADTRADAAGIGSDYNSDGGTFSTGTDGTATIKARSIFDNDDTSDWKGVIFDGVNGKVYGNQTLNNNFTIKGAEFLTVPENTTLTVNATLTNNGTLINNGNLVGVGTLAGNGIFKADVFTADDIADIPDQVYTGSKIEPTVTVSSSCVFKEKEFTLDTTGWIQSFEDNTNAGAATVKYSKANKTDITKEFNITAKPLTEAMIGEISSLSHTGEPIKPNVTITDGVKTLVEDTDYTVEYSNNINAGTATAIIKGKGNYSGTVTKDFTITKANQDALIVTGISPHYGTDSIIKVSGGNGTGAVTYEITNGTGSATITDSVLKPTKVGTVIVTATKAGDNNYNEVSSEATKITIDKGLVTGTDQQLAVVKEFEKEYTFDLSKMLPVLSDGLTYGDVSYSVSDLNDNKEQVLNFVPTDANISNGILTLSVANVSEANKIAIVNIDISSDNYDFTMSVSLSIKIVDRIPLEITATGTNRTYDGNPLAYTATPTFKNTVDDTAVTGISYKTQYEGVEGTNYELSETAPTNAGKYNLILTVSGESAYTYEGKTTIAFEITKANATITADDVASNTGDTKPEFTATQTGFMNDDVVTGVTFNENPIVDMNNIGQYAITPSGGTITSGEISNYNIAYVAGTLIIKDNQSLSFVDSKLEKTMGNDNFTNTLIGATTDVEYISSNEDVATVSNLGEVTLLSSGTATIKAIAKETSLYHSSTASYDLTVNAGEVDLGKNEVTTFDAEFANLEDVKITVDGNTTTLTRDGKYLTGYVGYTFNQGRIGEVNEGSVEVTLYKEFLATLPTGSYSLAITEIGVATPVGVITGTIPAKTTNNVTIANGGAGATVNTTATTGDVVKVTAGTKNDYTFKGWSVTGDVTVMNNEFIMLDKDVTLTAQWDKDPVVTPTPDPDNPDVVGPTPDPDNPDKGDSSNMMLYIILALVSLGGLGTVIYKRKTSE